MVWPSTRSIPSGQDIIPALKVSAKPGMAQSRRLGVLSCGRVVAAGAGVVAVDDQSEEAFDAWSGALEVLSFERVGELAQRGLAEVFAAAEADLALSAGRALCS